MRVRQLLITEDHLADFSIESKPERRDFEPGFDAKTSSPRPQAG